MMAVSSRFCELHAHSELRDHRATAPFDGLTLTTRAWPKGSRHAAQPSPPTHTHTHRPMRRASCTVQLNSSKATYDVVIGHHPLFGGAATVYGVEPAAAAGAGSADAGRPAADGKPSFASVGGMYFRERIGMHACNA